MGWAVGYDNNWERDVGYGVPSICDHPDCRTEIDRGLAHVCGGDIYGGETGCGLFFCPDHLDGDNLCDRCANKQSPYNPSPDTKEWIEHKLTDPTWEQWRNENGLNPFELRSLKI